MNPSQKAVPKNLCGDKRRTGKNAPTMGRVVAIPSATPKARIISLKLGGWERGRLSLGRNHGGAGRALSPGAMRSQVLKRSWQRRHSTSVSQVYGDGCSTWRTRAIEAVLRQGSHFGFADSCWAFMGGASLAAMRKSSLAPFRSPASLRAAPRFK